MENESRTMEQIYQESYSIDLFATNPLYLVEALGYIKAILQFMPYESWARVEEKDLKDTIKILMKEGVLK